MADAQLNVCIITVTYGDRWRFLEQVLQRASSFKQVSHIIVVDNASVHSVAGRAKQMDSDKVTVLTSAENLGSAGGYKKGLEYAMQATGASLFMLLDDDNVPQENVITDLLSEWRINPKPDDKKALFCFRDDRRPHVLIAKGEDPYRFYLVPDNFLGFHLLRIFTNKLRKARDKAFTNLPLKPRAMMPYVPYGGLMLHRDMIGKIGYPDERFYLYVDDSEFSYRITQSGGEISLIPTCRITDVDKSQGTNYQKKMLHDQLLDEWSFRTYYHVRNRIFFYSRVAIRNKFIFSLNKLIYLAWLRFAATMSNKTTEYKKLTVAINDGLKGNMGKAEPAKF